MKKKMPRLAKIFMLIGIILVSVWTVGRITGALQFYRSPTPANEPTIKTGSLFFASNLVKPARFDFLCYKAYLPLTNKAEINVYRICGIGGDVVELKNGELYINNENVDRKLNLKHFYLVGSSETEQLVEDKVADYSYVRQLSPDSSLVILEDKWVIENNFQAKRYIQNDSSAEITARFSKPWTTDNFGPIKVPLNHFFLLGDNRHNAWDSRFRGFASKDSVVGTVLWKH